MKRKIVGMLSVFTVGCVLYSNPILAETINNSEVATEQPVNATNEIANKIEAYAKLIWDYHIFLVVKIQT